MELRWGHWRWSLWGQEMGGGGWRHAGWAWSHPFPNLGSMCPIWRFCLMGEDSERS